MNKLRRTQILTCPISFDLYRGRTSVFTFPQKTNLNPFLMITKAVLRWVFTVCFVFLLVLGCLSIKSTFSGNSPGKENETDSGVNSMDFQEKLKLSDEEVIVTPSCHLPPIPAPRRMPEPTSHGRHQQSHHRSISVDRRDENSNGMSRLQTAKSRAAHIRARSKGQYPKPFWQNGRSLKFVICTFYCREKLNGRVFIWFFFCTK